MNIQQVLREVCNENFDFFLGMTEEEVKELPPYVLALWLRGSAHDRASHTIMTDMYLNTHLFRLYKHPKLLYLLACAGNSGISTYPKFQFIKDKKETDTKTVKAIRHHYDCNEVEAQMYQKLLTDEEIKFIIKDYEEDMK